MFLWTTNCNVLMCETSCTQNILSVRRCFYSSIIFQYTFVFLSHAIYLTHSIYPFSLRSGSTLEAFMDLLNHFFCNELKFFKGILSALLVDTNMMVIFKILLFYKFFQILFINLSSSMPIAMIMKHVSVRIAPRHDQGAWNNCYFYEDFCILTVCKNPTCPIEPFYLKLFPH